MFGFAERQVDAIRNFVEKLVDSMGISAAALLLQNRFGGVWQEIRPPNRAASIAVSSASPATAAWMQTAAISAG